MPTRFIAKHGSTVLARAALLWRIGGATALTGCAGAGSWFAPAPALRTVHFEVAAHANDSTPFAVELVAVSDSALLPQLLGMSAAQWFDPDANLKRDYPAALHGWYYELTPGLRLDVRDARLYQRGTRAVLLFAHYKGRGAFRLRLDATANARVLFAENSIALSGQP